MRTTESIEAAQTEKNTHRLHFLDGIRGWAAVVVVMHHIVACFLSQTVVEYKHWSLLFITDGPLAVQVFFVLSGFALTIKFIEKPGHYSIAQAASARYFRLTIPVLAVSFLAYLFLKGGLMFNLEAAMPGKSVEWIGTFFTFQPDFIKMLKFALYKVFFKYNPATSYNVTLWTMPIEFAGSMLIFSICALFLPKEKGRKIILVPILLACGFFFYYRPPLSCFIFGYFLAELYVRFRHLKNRWLNIAASLILPTLIWICTFHRPQDERIMILIAVLIVAAATFSGPLKAIFSSRLSQFLGRMSFPLYLVHLLIICSWSCYWFLALPEMGFSSFAAANLIVFSTCVLSLLGAWLFAPVETFSVRLSRWIAARITKFQLTR
ncbi:MAG: acyltransferase [Alphaproteobacteria bacterium]|nr:acyltransferase [Alphaproteobacteria bacterium]